MVRITIAFLKHFFASVNEHGVHSPFLYKLLIEGIYNQKKLLETEAIERIRKNLKSDHTKIQVTDLGAGSVVDGKAKTRSISFICQSFAKNPKLCGVLHRITKHLQPNNILELGTSLGISTMYLSAANPSAKVITVEGCPKTAAHARDNFSKLGLENIESLVGDFDDQLPSVLNRTNSLGLVYIDGNHTYEATVRYFHTLLPKCGNETCIIFDDIHWSAGMENAWKEISNNSRVTMSVDLFYFGIVFFDSRLSKEHFKIRI
ncbi:MAG: O-methyltransferase [Bacteroidota bacterium]